MSYMPGIDAFQTGFERFCVVANSEISDCSILLVGQMHATGTATPGAEVQVTGILDAIDKFGGDSIAAEMVKLVYCQCGGNGRDLNVTVLPVLDAVGSVAAQYTLTITGPVTATLGTLLIELPAGPSSANTGGSVSGNANAVYEIGVVAGDTATIVAAAVAAAVNADAGSFFTAVAALGVVTFTAKHGGTALNCIAIEDRPYLGYKVPAGLALLWAQTVQGAVDPDLATALAGVSACCFKCLAMGWSNPTTTVVLAGEMQDRWDCDGNGCMGHAWTYLQDTVPNIIAAAEPTDFPYISYQPAPCDFKYPAFYLAVSAAARNCCNYCQGDDAARPAVRSNGMLNCLCDPALCAGTPFTRAEQELLAAAGVSTWGIDRSGNFYIENNITNWKRNDLGQYDNRYTQVATRYGIMKLREMFSEFYHTYYDSHKVVANGIVVPANRRVTSPSAFKAHLIGWLDGQNDLGRSVVGELLAENNLASGLEVWLDTYTPQGVRRPSGIGDCNRMNVRLNARIIDSLLRIATTFDVQYCN